MTRRILAALEQARAVEDYDAEAALLDALERDRYRLARKESDRLAKRQATLSRRVAWTTRAMAEEEARWDELRKHLDRIERRLVREAGRG